MTGYAVISERPSVLASQRPSLQASQRPNVLAAYLWLRSNCWAFLLVLIGALTGNAAAGVVVDFEAGQPTSDVQQVGFRKQDAEFLLRVSGGANGTQHSGRAIWAPDHREVFLQGKERRLYLWSGKPHYEPAAVNILSFWMKVPLGSPLVTEDGGNSLGVWSYHWRPGDMKVGGDSNRGLMTDSMMHGYANFSFAPGCEGRWLQVVLSPSAFQQQRNYFHWYAAQGVTGAYDFMATLRQLQFKALGRLEQMVDFQIDEIGFERRAATAVVEPAFWSGETRAGAGTVEVPLVVRNLTSRDRSYRFFLSSELGASREAMYQPMWKFDDLYAAREVQQAVGGDGGLGVAVLVDAAGVEVGHREIAIPAGGIWEGTLLHRVRRKMLGQWQEVRGLLVHRDTLTTSVIFWDPEEPPAGDMQWVRAAPSNADDGRHGVPTGFPQQVRPPAGWRSEDIPLGQVGGYFVSELTLKP